MFGRREIIQIVDQARAAFAAWVSRRPRPCVFPQALANSAAMVGRAPLYGDLAECLVPPALT